MPQSFILPDLALLASQHHHSEYNLSKFGPQGCPIRYTPLSIHVPAIFKELQQRQLRSARTRSWWLCNHSDRAPSKDATVLGPNGAPAADPALQEELLAAIVEPLPLIPVSTLCEKSVLKTSRSHPLNVSSIIPLDLVSLISSQLFTNNTPTSAPPTVFDLPPSFTINRLAAPYRNAKCCNRREAAPLPPLPPVPPESPIRPQFRDRSTLADALRLALSSDLGPIALFTKPPADITQSLASGAGKWPAAQPEQFDMAKISPHAQGMAHDASTITTTNAGPNEATLDNVSVAGLVLPDDGWDSFSLLNAPSQNDNWYSPECTTAAPMMNPYIQLGNLYLSSCPGKKVRLQGPVKGRQGVCRDLETDMQRIRSLGVGCLVCCLDDGELEFLGSPWPKYQKAAKKLGMDVLRIPMPEGLAPTTPGVVDFHLKRLISQYTLKGVPVLVHCRGGVGRAGVIACCWLIKLGLCGWVEGSSVGIDQDLADLMSKDQVFPSQYAHHLASNAKQEQTENPPVPVNVTLENEQEALLEKTENEPAAHTAQIGTPEGEIQSQEDIPFCQAALRVDVDRLDQFTNDAVSDKLILTKPSDKHDSAEKYTTHGTTSEADATVVHTAAVNDVSANLSVRADSKDAESHVPSKSALGEDDPCRQPLEVICGMPAEPLAEDPSTLKPTTAIRRPDRNEVVSFVKKVIDVVRQRRSIKAVETYEQVQFLVEYVEYLRAGKGEKVDWNTCGTP